MTSVCSYRSLSSPPIPSLCQVSFYAIYYSSLSPSLLPVTYICNTLPSTWSSFLLTTSLYHCTNFWIFLDTSTALNVTVIRSFFNIVQSCHLTTNISILISAASPGLSIINITTTIITTTITFAAQEATCYSSRMHQDSQS